MSGKVNIAVLVSGGGTNLQALINAEKSGIIKSGVIKLVVSNNESAYALTRAQNADIKTAVSEAVTNAIIHGYGSDLGTVHISCEIVGKTFFVTVSDRGRGIENLAQAMQPLYTGSPEMERSGMGFTVMETFMDSLEAESAPGIGTTVRMQKTIGAEKA